MTATGSRPIRRGSAFMCFSTVALAPFRSISRRLATIPSVVRMQVASAVATRSVGEK